ncbi:hypothetical protein [Pigmentiphaga daeguensis]|uniref:Uncharacterized protein n=1 Tax=Pigmentiphaga daeguensis TaxID=414049 RepID=A0ABN1B8G0_9BURK
MNWSKIIRDLMDAGVAQREIAERIGVCQATVSQVLRAEGRRDLEYSKGVALIAMHQERCGEATHA